MIYLSIQGRSEVRLWGLDAATRLTRQLAQSTGFELIEVDAASAAAPVDAKGQALADSAQILVARADYLFEARTLMGLIHADSTQPSNGAQHRLLRCAEDQQLAAAFVQAADLPAALTALDTQNSGNFEVIDVAQLSSFDKQLRKAEAPLLKPCLLYTSPSPRDATLSRMPSSA